MRIIYYLILLTVVTVGIALATLNAEPVSFNYYFATARLAMSLLLVYVLAVGLILGFLLSLFPLLRCKQKSFQLKRRIKHMEKELENLRTLPIKDSH